MSSRTRHLRTIFNQISLETQEMQQIAADDQRQEKKAEAEHDAYLDGVDISANSAEEAIASTQLTASLSMEATPKELRNGMAIKFSHGHGKIARVFTAPFKMDGKHHHASKDTPIYLVKHDKGGKHSLHKASALSPRK